MQLIRFTVLCLLELVMAGPGSRHYRQRAVAPDNVVAINGPDDYWYVLKRVW